MPNFSPVTRSLERNLHAVQERLAQAARDADRDPADVQLLPVTKAVSVETARALCELGQLDLGENRADGLETKAAALADHPVRWHFIGHLQRNKARRVARLARVIHSVDSLALTEALARICAEEGLERGVYLQLNLTGETAKHGMDEAECRSALELACASPHLEVLGLMGMAPLVEQGERTAASVFSALASLAGDLQSEGSDRFAQGVCGLSMGMSADLELAVAAGSTCVRVGSDLYRGHTGERS